MDDFAKAFRIKITETQLNEFINSVVEVVDELTIETYSNICKLKGKSFYLALMQKELLRIKVI